MLKTIWLDGAVFEGKTAEDVVEAMRLRAILSLPKSVQQYMNGVRRRIAIVFGILIRVDDPGNFLTDLNKLGVIKFERVS